MGIRPHPHAGQRSTNLSRNIVAWSFWVPFCHSVKLLDTAVSTSLRRHATQPLESHLC